MLGINPLNFDVTICNMGAEMVILTCDVCGMRPHLGGVGKLNATFVAFKNGGMGSCSSNLELRQRSKLVK